MNFFDDLARSLERNRLTRRQALWLLGAGAAIVDPGQPAATAQQPARRKPPLQAFAQRRQHHRRLVED